MRNGFGLIAKMKNVERKLGNTISAYQRLHRCLTIIRQGLTSPQICVIYSRGLKPIAR